MSFYNYGKLYPAKNFQYSAEQMPILDKESKPIRFCLIHYTGNLRPKGLDKLHLTAKHSQAYIENQGTEICDKQLPLHAQVSSIFGMVVYDVMVTGILILFTTVTFTARKRKPKETMRLSVKCCWEMAHGNLPICPAGRAVLLLTKTRKHLR
jgi:hypothetical protein